MRIILSFILLLLPMSVFATTIGDVAENLMGPTALLTKLVIVSCYIVGIVLVFISMAQYKIHRQSPKLVPLSTPIILLVLGVLALFIPYVTGMHGDHIAKDKTDSKASTVLPLPQKPARKGLPPPPPEQPRKAPSRSAPQPSQPASPQDQGNQGGGGHWTSDPQYQ